MTSSLPYPVMSDSSEDYSEVMVDWSDIELSDEPDVLRASIAADVRDEVISSYMADGKAAVLVLVSCMTTDYRRIMKPDDIVIEKNMVSGDVDIETFISALTVIDGYIHPGLSEEYAGIDITIPKGGYLAIGPTFTLSVSRKEIPDADSICNFVLGGDRSDYYDDEQQYIDIYLTEEDFKDYNAMDKNCQVVFSSIHIPPVISDVIQKYWKERKEAHGQIWYTVLDEAIRKKYPTDADIDAASAYDIMISVIGPLMSRGSDNLYTVYNSAEGVN